MSPQLSAKNLICKTLSLLWIYLVTSSLQTKVHEQMIKIKKLHVVQSNVRLVCNHGVGTCHAFNDEDFEQSERMVYGALH